ncbi:hypothetical protein MROS_0148 [Melioribacter roseus P3M-2]|uniref:Uncharacterized protein n=1 Tax=Melioribacter roseus (strain DSM 23840 / JCM 17771 / VKM B-2668 / P3M-2) TaxID=1191523 RepID=I6YS92_MELRP|nr:hypothetical protein [Melioribacter roseus]AFN73392.1 hypothetical protein MROS_0148 [Melioribacter roseus P3M-2]
MKKLILLFVLILFSAEFIYGIPAFARKYRMSCQTCHAPFPKLKPYGDEFAGNGFRLSDQEAPRYYINTGDDDLSLIRELPLAVRLEGYTTYNMNNSDKFDFTAPYILKLLSGGELSNKISYYFYFFFSERGEVAGIEDAFLMYNDLFGYDLDIYLGQFQVSDPLFKRELRLTLEDYSIYKAKPGYAKAALTYDRGLMITYGAPSGTDIILEILNGNGIGEANNLKIFDDDKYKNVLLRISQDVNDNLRLGAFGYYGNDEIEDDFGYNFTNEFYSWGTDLTLSYENMWEFNLQYLYRNDKQATYFNNDVETQGGLAELIFSPEGDESKWYGVALFNWVDSEWKPLDYKTATIGVGHLLNRNIRLISECTYNIKDEFAQFSLGIISAF